MADCTPIPEWTDALTTTIRYTVDDPERLDPAEEALWSVGALSVTLLDAGDEPLLEPGPGETPVWSSARIEALLPDGVDAERIARALNDHGVAAEVTDLEVFDLPDRDWERAWMDRFEPMRFGRSTWICPSHIEPEPGWPVVIRLDPGLAFGTGTHATTALCLEWIDANDVAGARFVDYGCGSGVLAIAAALHGAGPIVAVDHDPQALEATRDNAARNGVEARIETLEPGRAGTDPADVVVANILAGPLVSLAPTLAARLADGGRLVLSGILESQYEMVDAAYRERLRPAGEASREGWLRLDYRAP